MSTRRIFTLLVAGPLVGAACLAAAAAPSQAQDTPGPSDPGLCPCVWYTSEKCECTAESECGCATCSRDASCACAQPLKAGTGTITGRIKNIYLRRYEGVVYIPRMPGRTFSPPPKNPFIDQKNLIFIPHVLPVLVGSTVDFPNSDSVRHNVFSTPKSSKIFNLGTYGAGVMKQVTFVEPGEVSLLCHVHAEMSAYVVVCRTPYFATTKKKDSGSFVIRNVPAGTWELTFFHPKLKAKTVPITVVAGEETTVEFTDLKRR